MAGGGFFSNSGKLTEVPDNASHFRDDGAISIQAPHGRPCSVSQAKGTHIPALAVGFWLQK